MCKPCKKGLPQLCVLRTVHHRVTFYSVQHIGNGLAYATTDIEYAHRFATCLKLAYACQQRSQKGLWPVGQSLLGLAQ